MSIDGYRLCSGELDDALLARVRAGDRGAFGELYERHERAAHGYARSMLWSDSDADDAVSEVFARLLEAIERGKGPRDAFPAYLFASLRHECTRISKINTRRGLWPAGTRADAGAVADDHASKVAEEAVVGAAFAALPADMRFILFLTEIDQLPQPDVAAQLDSEPATVATRAMRARRALGSAYLAQHCAVTSDNGRQPSACRETRSDLVGYLRGGVGARRRERVEDHLAGCEDCRAEHAHLGRLNGHLRAAAGPSVLACLRTLANSARGAVSAVVNAITVPLATTSVIAATSFAAAVPHLDVELRPITAPPAAAVEGQPAPGITPARKTVELASTIPGPPPARGDDGSDTRHPVAGDGSTQSATIVSLALAGPPVGPAERETAGATGRRSAGEEDEQRGQADRHGQDYKGDQNGESRQDDPDGDDSAKSERTSNPAARSPANGEATPGVEPGSGGGSGDGPQSGNGLARGHQDHADDAAPGNANGLARGHQDHADDAAPGNGNGRGNHVLEPRGPRRDDPSDTADRATAPEPAPVAEREDASEPAGDAELVSDAPAAGPPSEVAPLDGTA
jgi:RNA polymerase sigma factor (sigma-70 family)